MFKVVNVEDVPQIFKAGFRLGNFKPSYLYVQIVELPKTLPGNSLADYLDQVAREQRLPMGIFGFSTLTENELFRVTYVAKEITPDEVIEYLKTLDL